MSQQTFFDFEVPTVQDTRLAVGRGDRAAGG